MAGRRAVFQERVIIQPGGGGMLVGFGVEPGFRQAKRKRDHMNDLDDQPVHCRVIGERRSLEGCGVFWPEIGDEVILPFRTEKIRIVRPAFPAVMIEFLQVGRRIRLDCAAQRFAGKLAEPARRICDGMLGGALDVLRLLEKRMRGFTQIFDDVLFDAMPRYCKKTDGPAGLSDSSRNFRLAVRTAGQERRNVDDGNGVLERFERGWRWSDDSGKMEWRDEWRIEEEDLGEPDDRRCFREWRRLCNSIWSWIKMKEDVGSNYPSGRLPILDLEVYVMEMTSLWLPRKLSC